MKKGNLFLVLLMALIVMSCSKDETTMGIPQEGNAIEFGTYVGRDAQTRASMINTAAALQDKGFGVFAYYTDNANYITNTSMANFMYNQKLFYADGAWTYAPIKYWPNEVTDRISFFAYAPYKVATVDTDNFVFAPADASTAGDPIITFTVNDVVKSQEDLLWGVAKATITDVVVEGMPFLDLKKQGINKSIDFQFKHALARIGFNVEAMFDKVQGIGTGGDDDGADGDTNNGTIDDKTKIVVTKVELIGNFHKTGKLNLNNTTASVPLWTDPTPATATVRTFTLNAGADATVSNFADATSVGPNTDGKTFGQDVTNAKTKLNKDDSYIMVIPQKFESSNEIKIVVTYDVITKDDALDTKQSKITNTITSNDFTFNFEHGKAYTFNLHLGMTSVKFSADVSSWDPVNGTEHVVNVPINTTTP